MACNSVPYDFPEKMMKNHSVAIGIASAAPLLLEEWVFKGKLNEPSGMEQQGTTDPRSSTDYYTAETL